VRFSPVTPLEALARTFDGNTSLSGISASDSISPELIVLHSPPRDPWLVRKAHIRIYVCAELKADLRQQQPGRSPGA
jgi:hypothetical protein